MLTWFPSYLNWLLLSRPFSWSFLLFDQTCECWHVCLSISIHFFSHLSNCMALISICDVYILSSLLLWAPGLTYQTAFFSISTWFFIRYVKFMKWWEERKGEGLLKAFPPFCISVNVPLFTQLIKSKALTPLFLYYFTSNRLISTFVSTFKIYLRFNHLPLFSVAPSFSFPNQSDLLRTSIISTS